MRIRAPGSLLLLLPTYALAQAVLPEQAARRLRLEEAIGIAVQKNPALLGAGIDTVIATAQVEQARGLEDLVFDASLSGSLMRRDLVSGQPVQQTAGDGVSWRSGLTMLLPIGGRVGLRLDADYTRTAFAVSLNGMTQTSESSVFAPVLSLNLAQPLLRGVGVATTRAPRRRAAAARDAAVLQRQGVACAVVRDVVQAYWELAYAAAELDIRRAAVALAGGQLQLVRASIAVGKAPLAASAEVEASLALREDEVLQAERALLERSLDLRRLLGLEIGPSELAIQAVEQLEADGHGDGDPDLGRSLEDARAQNPQLQQVRVLGRAATIEVDVTENGMLPQLDLTASAGLTGNADDIGTSLQQLVSFRSYTVQGGLAFSLPLARHAARGARDAASAGVRKARLAEVDIEAQISAAVVRAAVQVRAASRRIAVLARSVGAAEKNLEGEQARYQAGRSTTFEVLRRQEELALTRLRRARAHADLCSARAALGAVTGAILAEHGLGAGG